MNVEWAQKFFFIFLWPLSIIYRIIIFSRNLFFDLRIFKQTKLSVSVISVGNITAGGTGKTPVVEYLATYYQDKGKDIAILSRGYKSKSNSSSVIREVDLSIDHAAKEFGDEPVLLADKLKIPVFVTSNKSVAAKIIENDFSKQKKPLDVLIVDDGYQHRSLNRNINVLVVDALATEKDCRLLPAGKGREPFSAISRADVVIITKGNLTTSGKVEEIKSKILSSKNIIIDKIIEFNYVISVFKFLFDADRNLCLDDFSNKEVVLLSAIGNPKSFENIIKSTLGKEDGDISHLIFQDHHQYRHQDVKEIIRKVKNKNGSMLFITEKDAVKLRRYTNLFKDESVDPVVVCLKLEAVFNSPSSKKMFFSSLDEVGGK